MVHKVKKSSEDNGFIEQYERNLARQEKEMDAELKRQREEYERFTKETEATAIATYQTVRGIYIKGKRAMAKGKRLGQRFWAKIKGIKSEEEKKRPVRVYVEPKKKDEIVYGEW